MASFATGYYVPSSMSQSYVLNKRDDSGTLKYQGAIQELGIQEQAALQNLESSYASTIENAYASYLANKKTINTSAMGQGYKELYQQAQEQQLLNDIATANMNLSSARNEIRNSIAEAQSNVQSQAQLETSYLNRTQGALTQYLQYINSLTGENGELVLSEEERAKTVDELYETLLGLSPKTFKDQTGVAGLSFADWVRTQLSGSTEDTAWGDWLFSGGLADFRNAVAKTERLNSSTDTNTNKKPYNSNTTNITKPNDHKTINDMVSIITGNGPTVNI